MAKTGKKKAAKSAKPITTKIEKWTMAIKELFPMFSVNSLNSSDDSIPTESRLQKKLINHEPGEVIKEKYEVTEMIAEGSFGKVFRALDMVKIREVAVKVLKSSVEKLKNVDFEEIDMLSKIKNLDPENIYNFIELWDCFIFKNHVYLVYDAMAMSVDNFLRENNYHPFNLQEIQTMATQIFTSMKFLHSNNIIHCDLKPANILLVNIDHDIGYFTNMNKEVKVIKKIDIKICDFGFAVSSETPHKGYRGTLAYTPPEVVLDENWDKSFDVWSIGCTLVELYTGKPLFQIDYWLDLLAAMERVFGRFPTSITERNEIYFVEGYLDYDEKQIALMNQKHQNLMDYMFNNNCNHYKLFELIRRMLCYVPSTRISFNEGLLHPFFHPFFHPMDEQKLKKLTFI